MIIIISQGLAVLFKCLCNHSKKKLKKLKIYNQNFQRNTLNDPLKIVISMVLKCYSTESPGKVVYQGTQGLP